MSDYIETCPSCEADLRAEGGTKLVGVVINDRVRHWMCPFCEHEISNAVARGDAPPRLGFRDCNLVVIHEDDGEGE